MLRALRRLLRPGGRIAFTTILVAPGLLPAQRLRARRSGPRAVASRREEARLLVSAGYVEVEHVDVTAEFAITTRAWVEESDRHREQLVAVQGHADFAQRQRERRSQLAAVEDGLLRRGLFSAMRPR